MALLLKKIQSNVEGLRWLSSAASFENIPMPLMGWEFRDARCKSGRYVGSALFDGNCDTVWDHFDPSVRQGMVSTMAFLKGKPLPNLPKPISTQGELLLQYIDEVIDVGIKSKLIPGLGKVSESIFHRSYDAICPLPSSKGPASFPNMLAAKALAKKLGNISVVPFIIRHTPMQTKSTLLEKDQRNACDAPRLIHFDTMSVNNEFRNDIRNCSILLYDDVMTWGNTSEAARNLLLLLGAREVDVVACFCTGDVFTSHIYKTVDPNDTLVKITSDSVTLSDTATIPKVTLHWENQKTLKEWHFKMKEYIANRFPAFVPNDIPF